MDWKYKHFNRDATFNALPGSVLEAARAAVAESLGGIADTADGFIARGHGAWNAEIATFRFTPAAEGTKVTVELLVERAAGRSFMLFDVGGYYNGQIDKWFSGIALRLGGAHEPVLVSKTTSNSKVWRGCLTGCLVYLIAASCLGIVAVLIDYAQFSQTSGLIPTPVISVVASLIGFIAGVVAFLYVLYPDAPASKFIRQRLLRTRNKETL
jgi:hypothetical protein